MNTPPAGVTPAAALAVGWLTAVLVLVLLALALTAVVRRILRRRALQPTPAAEARTPEDQQAGERGRCAPGTAGQIKLYDTPDRDAAMVMAIVADKMGKPLNELRFISIKEVKNT